MDDKLKKFKLNKVIVRTKKKLNINSVNQMSGGPKESMINLQKFVGNRLVRKHNSSVEIYNKCLIKVLVFKRTSCLVAKFKDHMIYDFIEEFLKRYYTIPESHLRLPKIANYFKNYSAYFCKPFFKDFKANMLILRYWDCKAEIFYATSDDSPGKKKDQNKPSSKAAKRVTKDKTYEKLLNSSARIDIENNNWGEESNYKVNDFADFLKDYNKCNLKNAMPKNSSEVGLLTKREISVENSFQQFIISLTSGNKERIRSGRINNSINADNGNDTKRMMKHNTSRPCNTVENDLKSTNNNLRSSVEETKKEGRKYNFMVSRTSKETENKDPNDLNNNFNSNRLITHANTNNDQIRELANEMRNASKERRENKKEKNNGDENTVKFEKYLEMKTVLAEKEAKENLIKFNQNVIQNHNSNIRLNNNSKERSNKEIIENKYNDKFKQILEHGEYNSNNNHKKESYSKEKYKQLDPQANLQSNLQKFRENSNIKNRDSNTKDSNRDNSKDRKNSRDREFSYKDAPHGTPVNLHLKGKMNSPNTIANSNNTNNTNNTNASEKKKTISKHRTVYSYDNNNPMNMLNTLNSMNTMNTLNTMNTMNTMNNIPGINVEKQQTTMSTQTQCSQTHRPPLNVELKKTNTAGSNYKFPQKSLSPEKLLTYQDNYHYEETDDTNKLGSKIVKNKTIFGVVNGNISNRVVNPNPVMLTRANGTQRSLKSISESLSKNKNSKKIKTFSSERININSLISTINEGSIQASTGSGQKVNININNNIHINNIVKPATGQLNNINLNTQYGTDPNTNTNIVESANSPYAKNINRCNTRENMPSRSGSLGTNNPLNNLNNMVDCKTQPNEYNGVLTTRGNMITNPNAPNMPSTNTNNGSGGSSSSGLGKNNFLKNSSKNSKFSNLLTNPNPIQAKNGGILGVAHYIKKTRTSSLGNKIKIKN